MEAIISTVTRSYQDFQPPSDMIKEEKSDTLSIKLPGFKKDQLRVQLDSRRIVKISGERQIEDHKWIRFRTDFQVPDNCNLSEIRAKFENETLSVIMPKGIIPIEDKPAPTKVSPMTETPAPAKSLPTTQKAATESKTSKDQNEIQQKSEQMVGKSNSKGSHATSAAGTGKQLSEKSKETEVAKHVAEEMPKKEKNQSNALKEKEKVTVAGKMATGSMETVTDGLPGSHWYEKGGMKMGLKKHRRLVVSVVVAAVVVAAIGLFVSYRSKSVSPVKIKE